jgi:hypothetical protein
MLQPPKVAEDTGGLPWVEWAILSFGFLFWQTAKMKICIPFCFTCFSVAITEGLELDADTSATSRVIVGDTPRECSTG